MNLPLNSSSPGSSAATKSPLLERLRQAALARGDAKDTAGILAAKLGRAVYHVLHKKVAFDEQRFWVR